MEIGHIIPHIEALIFASDKPLTSIEITELINNAFGFMEEKLTLEQIQTSIDGIREKYASEFYPFEVRESGGGWQFLTKRDFHKTIAQLNGDKFLKRLSSAALETLAIIAYKQPITKGEIEAIRGVSSDYSIQKLLEKELIVITGRNEDMPGKPLVYCTSKTFMDYFGINSPADLPKLKEVFAETLVEPTVINHSPSETLPDEDTDKQLAVGENGQLIEHADQGSNEGAQEPDEAGRQPDEVTHGSDEVTRESDELPDGGLSETGAQETTEDLNEVSEGESVEEANEVADEGADQPVEEEDGGDNADEDDAGGEKGQDKEHPQDNEHPEK